MMHSTRKARTCTIRASSSRAGSLAFFVVSILTTTAAPAATAIPTPTPTQPSMLGVSPSASRVVVTVFRIDRSRPILKSRIAVVARDGAGSIVRTARAFDDPSLLQTPEEPRFSFAFEPPLGPVAEPYTIEATALDLGFGGSGRLIVVPVPTDIGRAGDPFIATWWSSGATPGVPLEKQVTPDGSVSYVSHTGKQRIGASTGGLYPEFADDDVARLRATFYGHDAIGSGVFIQCEGRSGEAMQAKLVNDRRIRIQEIGRAAHASVRVADDPMGWFGGGDGVFVDSPIVAEFGLASGDVTIESSGIESVHKRHDATCVRGFVLFQSAAQMLSVFSRA